MQKDKIRGSITADGVFATLMGGVLVSVLVGMPTIFYSQYSNESKKREYRYELGLKPIRGEVLEERYENTLSSVPEKHIEGLVSQAHSNETVKLESKYTLKIQTQDGRTLGVSIFDGPYTKKEALDILIDKGSWISFPRGDMYESTGKYNYDYVEGETFYDDNTRFGNKRADRIEIK
jgi:hypothetical protein